MKFWLGFYLTILMAGCSVSEQEKSKIIIAACNIIQASSDFQSTFRLEKVNAVREQIGGEIFLGTDEDIKTAVEYDLCPELIALEPLAYQALLSETLRSFQRALMEELVTSNTERLQKFSPSESLSLVRYRDETNAIGILFYEKAPKEIRMYIDVVGNKLPVQLHEGQNVASINLSDFENIDLSLFRQERVEPRPNVWVWDIDVGDVTFLPCDRACWPEYDGG